MIREVIVVEGRHDEALLKQYFDCDVIVTGGLALNDQVLEQIREAQRTRGVIVFTDPDAPGNRIRARIDEAVPGCKHAYVDKKKARTAKKVGVEHAAREVLEEALSSLSTLEHEQETITSEDMYELGLLGRADSRRRRTVIGEALRIGDGNAKTMRRRLNGSHVTKKMIEEILNGKGYRDSVENEGNH